MASEKSVDIRLAILVRRFINYYIKKRMRLKSAPSGEEVWNSLFINTDSIEFEIDNELRIILNKESLLCRQIYFGFEKEEIAFLRRFLRNGDTFIDIGANIGLFSLHASKIVGREGKIYAFEPTPQTFQKLLKNLDLNHTGNIEAIQSGLSNTRSELDFHVSMKGYDAWNSFAILEEAGKTEIIKAEVDTLDSFISEKSIDKIDLIKMDVEGWEKFVLEGATGLLSREEPPVFLVEFTETNTFAAGYYPGEIYDMMKNYGFEWYSYQSDLNALMPEKKKLHYPYQNLLAIKNYENCLKRIAE
jgi:FkbM family methyltransferase